MKMAIYTCNFGNYRNEFDFYYNVNIDKNIDHFLFTDKKLSEIELTKLKNFTVINIDLLPGDEIMNNYRWTAKYVKFILPEILKDYDILVWVDNKIFKNQKILDNIEYKKIINIINNHPNDSVFNFNHFARKTMQQELIETIKIGYENKESGKFFLHDNKHYTSKFILVDTCVIIRKNDSKINEAFEYCFELMKEYKLKRDQNIYNFAFDAKNITPVILDIHKFNINLLYNVK